MAEIVATSEVTASQKPRKWAMWLGWAITIALLSLFTAGLLLPRSLVAPPLPAARDFEMPLFAGGTARLSDYRGQVVVLNIWASWCIPCRDEAPVLQKLSKEYERRGVVFLGVNIQDTEKDARAFIKEFGVTYLNGYDVNGTIYIQYGVTGVPETFIIDAGGNLVRKHIGPINEYQMRRYLEETLQ